MPHLASAVIRGRASAIAGVSTLGNNGKVIIPAESYNFCDLPGGPGETRQPGCGR